MASSVPLGGIASLTIDGNSVLLVSGVTYQTADTEQESQTGSDGIHGFFQKIVVPFIAFKVRLTPAQPLSDYDGLTSSTVVVTLINGTTVSGYTMWITKAAEGDALEATADLRFEGFSVSVDLAAA